MYYEIYNNMTLSIEFYFLFDNAVFYIIFTSQFIMI